MERTIPGIRSILYTATPALLRVQVRTRPCQGLSCRRACCLVLPAIRHTTTGGTAMCTDPSCPVQRSFGSPGGGGIVTDRLRCCALRRRRFSRSFAASLSRRRSAGVAALPLPVDRASLFMASLPSDSPPAMVLLALLLFLRNARNICIRGHTPAVTRQGIRTPKRLVVGEQTICLHRTNACGTNGANFDRPPGFPPFSGRFAAAVAQG